MEGGFSLQLGNTAGIGWNLANGLLQAGWRSAVVELEPETGGFPADLRLHMTRGTNLPIRLVHVARIARLARHADIVHFHFGIRPFARYIRWICEAPFVVHYHGSDLRESISDGYRDLAAAEFISTPDLRRWAPRATWIPNPIVLPDLSPRTPSNRVAVGHFPSNPDKKGTRQIVDAIRRLQSRFDFDFHLVSGVSHEKALQQMLGCDIIIDQISPYGVYGMVSVEAMSLGRVVLSSIDDSYYDRCPIIPVTERSFEDRLWEILSSPNRREKLGTEGRSYAERIHDSRRVAALVLEQYERIR